MLNQFKVYGNRVVAQQSRYFVRQASAALVGAFGKKRTPIGQQNYLDVEGVLSRLTTPVNVPTSDSVEYVADFDSSFGINHVGMMNLPLKMVDLAITDATAYQVLRSGTCRFLIRSCLPVDVMDALNSRSDLIDRLKDDNDYRVVTSVIWLKSCTITTAKGHDVDLDGTVSIGIGGEEEEEDGDGETGLKKRPRKGLRKAIGKAADQAADKTTDGVTISIVGDDSTSITRNLVFQYGENSVMAYGLHKLEWDKVNKNRRTRITGMKADWQGLS